MVHITVQHKHYVDIDRLSNKIGLPETVASSAILIVFRFCTGSTIVSGVACILEKRTSCAGSSSVACDSEVNVPSHPLAVYILVRRTSSRVFEGSMRRCSARGSTPASMILVCYHSCCETGLDSSSYRASTQKYAHLQPRGVFPGLIGPRTYENAHGSGVCISTSTSLFSICVVQAIF